MLTHLLALAYSAPTIPVQGDLIDAAGAPLQGTHAVSLSIYDQPTGGAALWTETDTVTFAGGAFATVVGDAPGFDPAIFHSEDPRYLGLTVDGGAPSDRAAIGWAPRAGWAADAGALDGRPASDFVLTTDDVSWSKIIDEPSFMQIGDAVPWAQLTDLPSLQLTTDSLAWARITDVPSLQLTSDAIAWSRITDVPELGRTYTAGTGLTLTGTAFAVDGSALDATYARRDSANPIKLGATGTSSTCNSGLYGTIRWTGTNFEGCTPQGWRVLSGAGGGATSGTPTGDGSASNPGRTCRTIKYANPSLNSGLYWIDPELDGAPIQVQCDMSRAGGGWTFAVKAWYQSGIHGQQGAVGSVADALTLKGAAYKISDDDVRDIIGPSNNFDLLMDQAGYNTASTAGNYEYATLENYTAWFTFGSLVLESRTATTMKSYRASDGAVAWTGSLGCGPSGGISWGAVGVNCYNLLAGTNPAGGGGCIPNMGSGPGVHAAHHHFYMSEHNQDTYLYLCNGSQHSSSHNMNHRTWVRERVDPVVNSLGTQGNPARTCKSLKSAVPTAGDGVYWLDPESDGSPIQAQCDMTRAGGGWTLGLKAWYQAGIFGSAGAVGTVADALTLKGANYKLSDNDINDIIGPSRNFDVLADQAGYNHSYSGGNYEYATLENYTATFTFATLMPESSTTTVMKSLRASDGATMWTGRLLCGVGTTVHPSGKGINCYDLAGGSSNPAGGSGCASNLGAGAHVGRHHFYMSEHNQDTYLYLCNGAQHSSDHNMNHRFWFRERS
jgi:hypothetical protein